MLGAPGRRPLQQSRAAAFLGRAVRFALATAILFALVALRGIMVPRGRALWGAIVDGVGQYFVTLALLYWALVPVPAG